MTPRARGEKFAKNGASSRFPESMVRIVAAMCQRYVLPEQLAAEREFVPAVAWWNFAPKFNVAAAQYVPAIRLHDGASEGVMLRWGLIPSWFEGKVTCAPKTSVKQTRLDRSRVFQGAWRGARRCILPAAGFYSWQLTQVGHRQPHFVQLAQRAVFGMAAIWDRWVSEDDDVIEGCSIVIVPANELMADISSPAGGMPAILKRKDYDNWLGGDPAAAAAALNAYPAERMQSYPVSPRINSADVDDRALIDVAS